MSTVPVAQPRVRALVLSPRLALGGIVAAATVLHALLARLVAGPSVFPDAYIYSQLGRSLSTQGRLAVRGTPAHFPALLEPLLTAPVWLVHDVGTAYRLLQLENALVMSLAAVPAYLIARRLRASAGLALGAAALAVAGPQLMFVGMILSEPFAYPLALATVAAALRAVERPSLRAQLWLLVLCGLSVLSRMQLAVLPICVAAAILLVAARERRVRRALREQWLLFGLLGLAALGAAGLVALHGFGYYHPLSHFAGAGGAVRLAGIDSYIVLLMGGVALAPSALTGLALGLVRPRFRAEAAFSALAWLLGVAIVCESVLWEHDHRVQERYLCYLVPLLALGSALRFSREGRRPVAELGVAAGIAAVAALVPLDGYAASSARGLAPFLYAFNRVDHGAATTSELFALGITVLAVVGVAGAALRRGALPVFAVALVASLLVLVAAASWSGRLSRDLRSSLPADASWIDDALHGAPSTMLVTGPAPRGQTLATVFWNPSVTRVVKLPKAPDVDELHDPAVRVDGKGSIFLGGKSLQGPVVVASPVGLGVSLADARLVEQHATLALWRPAGDVRLATTISNRGPSGLILHGGSIEAWSGHAAMRGWLELRVHVPASLGRVEFRLGNPRRGRFSPVPLAPGTTRTLRVAACGAAPYQGGFSASWRQPAGVVYASPLVGLPRYVPDPRACG